MENEKELYLALEKEAHESFDKWYKAYDAGDYKLAAELNEECLRISSKPCIHDRDINETCMRCDELFIECYPERHGTCLECQEVMHKDNLFNGVCWQCKPFPESE